MAAVNLHFDAAGRIPASASGNRHTFFHEGTLDARAFKLGCQALRFAATAHR
jgi:hypothetical protein